jgi:hypothetical protein
MSFVFDFIVGIWAGMQTTHDNKIEGN